MKAMHRSQLAGATLSEIISAGHLGLNSPRKKTKCSRANFNKTRRAGHRRNQTFSRVPEPKGGRTALLMLGSMELMTVGSGALSPLCLLINTIICQRIRHFWRHLRDQKSLSKLMVAFGTIKTGLPKLSYSDKTKLGLICCTLDLLTSNKGSQS